MILEQIKEKCAWLADNNDYVTVRYDKIPNYVADIISDNIPKSSWNEDWHYMGNDEDTLAYIIALDSINFGSGYFSTLKKCEGTNSGYATVAMGLKDIFEDNPLTAKELAKITAEDCATIFNQDESDVNIWDLMMKFSEALNETGRYISLHYDGSFTEFVVSANGSAEKLVDKLAEITYFKDVSIYKGKEIPIYKRAQITVGDIYTAFKGKGLGSFSDIGELTVFADNVVPHVLRYDGILEYSDELTMCIDAGKELGLDDEAEIALRACSIHAVEKIIEELHATGNEHILTLNVDHWLWSRGHEDYYMDKKRHMTKTVCY